MLHYVLALSSEPVMTAAGLCLGLAVVIYFALRYWWKAGVISRGRARLLSIGAALSLGLMVLQLCQCRQSVDEDLLAEARPWARLHGMSVEALAASGLAVVATYHNDNARTGQNTLEAVLTPDNVNAAHFGKLYSFPVDGYVYAQPLYVPQVAIPGNGIHNVVIVATEHDSVYAFDADSPTPTPLWHVNFLNPAAGITPLTPSDVHSSDIVPEIGITSTPVIDVASNTLYVVAATKENGAFYHRLHALELASGAEKFGGPRLIQASYPGVAQDSSNGVLSFASHFQLQRAALLLSKGRIYVAFASNADFGMYHGWVIAFDATSLRQVGAWVSTPNGYQGGIWMSGCGISADDDGDLYLSIANGPFDAFGPQPGVNYGDSVVKLRLDQQGLKLVDFFTPYDQAKMQENDFDLGSAGVMLLPDQAGPYRRLAITTGKNGHIYLLNRDNLGGYYTATRGDPQIVQELAGQLKMQMGTPAYWNGRVYFGAGNSPGKDSIKAFTLRNGMLSRTPVSQTAATYHITRSTVSISANGNSNGIVWAVNNDAYYEPHQGPAVLHAYDALNLGHELYNSNQRFARDNPGETAKFTVPTVANGKVFVGTANQVSVYGLLPLSK
ncbi:MAG TPA: hypothetical protein VKV05_03775 [Terriglobales bacterium]|nr:hypothetical protein [Terriglobales bacterium]